MADRTAVLPDLVAEATRTPTDLEMAQDLMAALIYWRMVVRQAPVEPDYLDRVTEA